MKGLIRKEMVVKRSRSIRLCLAGLAAIAVLSGCGNSGNSLAPQIDTTPPPAPENLTVVNDQFGWPVLGWTASAAPDVVGYQLYVYSALPDGSNGYVPADDTICAGTTFRLESVANGAVASYRVRAVDAAGNQSAFSTSVEVQVPAGGASDRLEIE